MDLAELYRDVLETSPDGIWVFDLDGRTVYANPAIARMYGVDVAELADLTVFDTLDEPGRAQFRAHLEDLRADRVNVDEVDVQFVRRDGSTIWVRVRESALRAPDGTIEAVLHRISGDERRAILEELEESRQRLAEAQRIARLGSWEWDVGADRIVASPELLALYGLPADAAVADYAGFLDRVHEEDRAHVDAVVRRALDDGEPELMFLARIRGHGGWVWTRGRGVVHRRPDGRVLMSGTHQDVSETQRAHLALKDQVSQNTLLQAVASAANEAGSLTEVLRHAGTLVLLHDDWERGRAFVPSPDGDRVVPLVIAEQDRLADEADPARSADELALAQEAFRRRESVWSRDGLTIAFCVTVHDEVCAVVTITSAPPLYRHTLIQQMVEQMAVQLGRVAERERAQRELARTRDQAMEASRQKSEFLATMSHEIRTPLNGVIGLNDLLLRTGLSPEQLRLASGVQVASRALLGVINDILDFSKIEAGRLELEVLDFEVRTLLDQVISVLAENARAKGLDLSVSCAPEVPEVLAGDPTRIAQVLTNLVSNAVKFTDRGRVEIRARTEPAGPGADDDQVVLRIDVSDTGVGIDRADVESLFDPFTQADASTTRVYGGTGLGLAIARDIVEALGGRLGHADRPGGGSIFTFTAALRRAAGTHVERQDAHARELLAGRRVLVVDEVEANRAILTEQLAWWNVEVEAVASTEVALAQLSHAAAHGVPYDAVLLDLSMPDHGELDLAAAVRSRPEIAETTLLVLSSAPSPLSGRAGELGVADHLVKPVLTSSLRATLLEHLAGVEEPRTPTPDAEPQPVRHRVLVVEDNPVNQMVATGLLESLGYLAHTADDGLAALEVLRTECYDAILMDVQMPRMDGYSTTRALRSREPDGVRVPVVAMTAAALEGERERCLDAGMDDFLTKPVDAAAVDAVLTRWLDEAVA